MGRLRRILIVGVDWDRGGKLNRDLYKKANEEEN
jgi:hypothetical protein